MTGTVKIKVEVVKEVSGEFLALYNGELIKIDPFVTDCIYEDNCPTFEKTMMLSGVWYDKDVFLVTTAESIS